MRHYSGICGNSKIFVFFIPLFVCLRMEYGKRDRDSGSTPQHTPRARNATPSAGKHPTAYRAAAQSGKNGYMVINTMYSTHFYGLERNSKRREVTAQREREGLGLTLKLSQAGFDYIPKLGL